MTTATMKKFIGSIKGRTTNTRSKSDTRTGSLDQQPTTPSLPQGDHPEAVVVREAFAFCEAGAPGSASAGDEYLHLPAIVDACESSPTAAREAAATVQRYFSKQNFQRGYAQYNAVMLMRILTDNPGRNFTQFCDKGFVSTTKNLLRECRDSSVQQIMRETLDYFEAEKLGTNDSLTPLIEMWRKEKGSSARMYSSSGRSHTQPYANIPNVPHSSRPSRSLPPPDELAARIEEAKTSARLLVQMVQSTPPAELLGNDLIKEFAERAKQANKSIQQYMSCENPPPDEHTMLTLIETSEQLSISMTKHQRAVVTARRATGQASAGTSPQPQPYSQDPFSTGAMRNSLPPQAPLSQQQQQQYSQPYPQHQSLQPQPYQPRQAPQPQQYEQDPYAAPVSPPSTNRYLPERSEQQQGHSRYESDDLYNDNTPIVSPVGQSEHSFLPPPGPPPPRMQEPPNMHHYDQQQPLSTVQYNSPQSGPNQASATKAFNVADNPFADDSAYAAPADPPPPRQQSQSQSHNQNESSYAVFNRAAGQLRDPASPTFSNTQPQPSPEPNLSSYTSTPAAVRPNAANRQEPNAYNSGWQPTPSFVGRQQSSEAHITMSGASPPRS